MALVVTACQVGCVPPDDELLTAEVGVENLEREFETLQFAIETATCGELAFRFDIPLSERLLASSFESYVSYFESLEDRIPPTAVLDNVLVGPRERAAAALGRVLGATSERLTQDLRDQGGGDAKAAARDKFRKMGCPT